MNLPQCIRQITTRRLVLHPLIHSSRRMIVHRALCSAANAAHMDQLTSSADSQQEQSPQKVSKKEQKRKMMPSVESKQEVLRTNIEAGVRGEKLLKAFSRIGKSRFKYLPVEIIVAGIEAACETNDAAQGMRFVRSLGEKGVSAEDAVRMVKDTGLVECLRRNPWATEMKWEGGLSNNAHLPFIYAFLILLNLPVHKRTAANLLHYLVDCGRPGEALEIFQTEFSASKGGEAEKKRPIMPAWEGLLRAHLSLNDRKAFNSVWKNNKGYFENDPAVTAFYFVQAMLQDPTTVRSAFKYLDFVHEEVGGIDEYLLVGTNKYTKSKLQRTGALLLSASALLEASEARRWRERILSMYGRFVNADMLVAAINAARASAGSEDEEERLWERHLQLGDEADGDAEQ